MAGALTTRLRSVLTGFVQIVGGATSETLVGAKTIDDSYGNLLALDPGGAARVVTLRDSDDNSGDFFLIANKADADEAITVKDSAGNTVTTIEQNYAALVVCNGGSAWSLFCQFSQTDTTA